jgi:predicted aspartyl protease
VRLPETGAFFYYIYTQGNNFCVVSGNHLTKMKIITTLILLALWVPVACLAQGGDITYPTEPPVVLPDDVFYEIPFDYTGQIMLKVAIGGKAYNFAFDTGGYNMITDAVKQELGLEVLGEKELGSANGLVKTTNIVFAPLMALGGLMVNNVQAYQVNFDQSPIMQCMVNGGFIGSEIIKNYIWQIDYPNRKIIVTQNINNLPGATEGTKIPVHLNKQNQPYVMVNINGTYQYMMFDTGCSSLLMLSEQDAGRYTPSAKGATLLGGMVETHNGRVRDTLQAFDASIDANGIKLMHKPALYRKGAKLTLLGNPIIKNYIVTLDFAHGALYLQPIKDAPVTPGWEHFGFTLEYNGECAVVGALLQNSPAQKAGLLPGDEVTAINGKKVTCADYCTCRENFNTLLDATATISLTVLKNGVAKNLSFKKEKIF